MGFFQNMAFVDVLFFAWLVLHAVIGWFGRFLQGFLQSVILLVAIYLVNYELVGLSGILGGIIDSEKTRLVITYVLVLILAYLIGSFLNMYLRSTVGHRARGMSTSLLGMLGGVVSYVFVGCLVIYYIYNFMYLFYPDLLNNFAYTASYKYFLLAKRII